MGSDEGCPEDCEAKGRYQTTSTNMKPEPLRGHIAYYRYQLRNCRRHILESMIQPYLGMQKANAIPMPGL
ncbi:MAG: hypothetical protein QXM43_00305 [Desulfurococcaceae archaeon]